MAIVAETVEVFGGTGGPLNNAIPVYDSKKLNDGGWAYDLDGKTQLKLENGKKLVRINPSKLMPGDNLSAFFSFNGEYLVKNIVAARVWIYNEETKKGDDWQRVDPVTGQVVITQLWVENSHLRPLVVDPLPDPDPDPSTDPVVSGVVKVKSIKIGGVTISFDELVEVELA